MPARLLVLGRGEGVRSTPLRCGLRGTQMQLIAFVTGPLPAKTCLGYLSEPTTPPEVGDPSLG